MTTTPYILLAATEGAAENGLLGALGIDWRLLILQTIAFLILVAFLAKFVYPVLTRAIDNRQKAIEDSVKAAEAAKKQAENAEDEVAKALREARKQAEDIVATAHKEAVAMVEDAEAKAKKRSDHIITEARSEIEAETRKAATALRRETAQLVATATETIIGEKLDGKKDEALIAKVIGDSKG